VVHKLVHRVFLQLCAHNRTEALAHWSACRACPDADWSEACQSLRALGSETARTRPGWAASDTAPPVQAPRRSTSTLRQSARGSPTLAARQ
jgi:hypothetical protein